MSDPQITINDVLAKLGQLVMTNDVLEAQVAALTAERDQLRATVVAMTNHQAAPSVE